MSDEQDKEFVEFIIKGIVNHPGDVSIERSVDEMGVLLTVKVHPEDMGIIIGRQGATAKSIRSLARIRGMRNNARVNIRIIEPDGSTRINRVNQTQTPAPETNDGNKNKNIDDVVGDLGM